MATVRDAIGFTTFRLRHCTFSEIEDELNDEFAREYASKGAERKPKIFAHHSLPDVVIVQNILQQNLLPNHPKLFVDSLCGAAVLRGANVFAAGVVGCESAAQKEKLVSVFACTDKFNAGFKTYNGNCVFIGNGILCIDRKLLLGNLMKAEGIAVDMVSPVCICPSFQSSLFTSGRLVAQNLPSLTVAWVTDCCLGDTVLDMCAAPGGKCLHLADIMQNTGTVIAIDKSSKRLQSLRDSATKLGITNVRAYCFDSCRLFSEIGNDADGAPPFKANSFNKILLDAPCSALGQRPQLLAANDIRHSDNHLKSIGILQRKLLNNAVQLLRSGGTLIYSTCTTRTEENEQQVEWLLQQFPQQLQLQQQSHCLRPMHLQCADACVQKFDFCAASPSVDKQYDYDTIGFFIAKFVKIS